MNLGVQALLSWVRTTVGPQGSGETVIDLEELRNGELLLKIVYLMKEESNPHLSNSVDDCFKIITDFVEKDCRFSALKGTPISWKDIKDGTNLTTEISKVLLLLVYHDMMNDHRTLNTLDCEVENQIATLTTNYVMESEGNVYLKPGLDAYLTRRYLAVPLDIFEQSTTTSVSSVSSVYEDDESPLFVRSQKVKFQDMQKVSSSSVSNSPLQDIMNTPIFQMRKMQRQLIQDRDYRDGLEKELSNKLAVLAQRESQINQLQYCLDKMKKEQGAREEATREHIDELENKNGGLHSRFNDVLKENKELKNNTALMERKVDELADENGMLSSQMRTVCSQLAIFEAEVSRLTETQTTNEREWKTTSNHLQSELNQARAQKELLAEQIEILQAKISCLEDEISKATKEEVGENMWLAMEKKTLENKITTLTDELEGSIKSLQIIEEEVQTKTQQLKQYEQEIAQQKELFTQQENQRVQLIQSKNEAIETLQKEMTKVRQVLQDDINQLKLQLEQAEQQKKEQISRLHQQVDACKQEIDKLKEIKRQKEDLLIQAEASVVELTEKLCAANILLVEKDQEVNRLTKKVDALVDMHKQAKDESQAKEEMFSQLLLKKSQEEETLQSNIQSLTGQVENLMLSLKQAEEEVQVKQNLLSKTQQEKGEQIEVLQQNIIGCEETIMNLKGEIQVKSEQLVDLKLNSSRQSEKLQEEILALKSQIDSLCESLRQAEQQVQAQQVELRKQEEESSQEKGLLQQQLTASKETVNILKAEIKMKTEQMSLMENINHEQSESWKNEINALLQQVEGLKSQLAMAEEGFHLKEGDFAVKQQQSSQQVEELQVKISKFQGELKRLHAQMQIKEEELLQLKEETSAQTDILKTEHLKQSEVLTNEIQGLSCQVQSLHESLNSATEQLKVKEEFLASKEMEISHEKDVIHNLRTTLNDEIKNLKLQINDKEEQMVTLKNDADNQSNLHQQEIQNLKNQLHNMTSALSKAEEKVQTQLLMLTQQEKKSAQEQDMLQQKFVDFKAIIRKLEDEISAREEQLTDLKTHNQEQSNVLCEQNNSHQRQLEALATSLKEAEEKMCSKECLLAQQQQENTHKQEELSGLQVKVEQMENQISSFKHTSNVLQESLNEKEDLLVKAHERYQVVQMELAALKTIISERDKEVGKLKQEAMAQAGLIHKTEEEVQNKEKLLIKFKEERSKEIETLQHTVAAVEGQVQDFSVRLVSKEEQLNKIQQESAQQIDILEQKIVSVNAELNQQNQKHAQELRQVDEMLLCTQKERDSLFEEKEALAAKVLAVEKELEVTVFENKRLAEARQAIEGQNLAAQKLETMLQQKLELLRQDNGMLLKEKIKVEEVEMVKKDLLQQLSAKSTAVEHYKAQMEKAMSHYNSKKQLLHETEEEVANLKHSLEVKEREVKTASVEHKLLQMELEKIKSNENVLLSKVASLEAQLAFADQVLRAQNKIPYSEQPRCNMDVPSEQYSRNPRGNVRCMSSDSLDTSSLDESLNNTRKLSAPDEASTPLVRSSERLAAKRRGLQAESLETLYFTPINTKHRTTTGSKHHGDSAMQNPASSVKRRRTTQVINITLTKKTPGCNEAEESFYSLTSARSQPNLSGAHKAQGISTELFTTPAKVSGSGADQLIGLPGYRRSTIHSQPTSTFCVGAENEPEGGPEDWMRIAEIQARNKACLPHLKSSYPIEFDAVRNSALIFTDEELRTGDPSETIRRASMMPGQLQDSLTSHRVSYMMGQGGAAATAHSRLSLMPGQVVPKSTSSTNLRSPKGTKRAPSTLTVPLTSPEKKVRASCFPRPLTPKNKNGSTGPAIPKIQAALSPASRRQSMMFTIDNTPKKDGYLKKSLNKLRSSTRKSPGKSVKKSPAQAASRKGQENMPSRAGRTATGGAGRLGSQKSPLVASKGLRKSPQGTRTRAAKSPGLTASARKMMSRMKV